RSGNSSRRPLTCRLGESLVMEARCDPHSRGRLHSSRRSMLLLSAALVSLLGEGCVYRRMIVRSDPPGARVIIDGQEVGYTPVGGLKMSFSIFFCLLPLRAPWDHAHAAQFSLLGILQARASTQGPADADDLRVTGDLVAEDAHVAEDRLEVLQQDGRRFGRTV